MNIYKSRFLILLLSFSLLLSGCDKISAHEYTKGENISADFGAVDNSIVFTEGESTNIQASEPVETNIISVEPQITTALKSETENQNSESYLPPNMSMDDLLNMIQIDGKTLSMPTTLEDILALNDDFTCEMAFSDLYSTPEKCIENMGGVFYDINYKGEKFLKVVIFKDDYNGDCMSSVIYRFVGGFGKKRLEDLGIAFSLTNNINLYSTSEDIKQIFGDPNSFIANEPYNYIYAFYNDEVKVTITFGFIDKSENGIYSELGVIQYEVERMKI